MALGLALPPASSSTSFAYTLRIPRLGVMAPLNYVTQDLGPYIYYQDSDTIAIAGHRVTHTHPFLHIDQLQRGNKIFINKRKFVVVRYQIIKPTEVWVLNYKGLVLSACTPPHSASYRYVVFAKPFRAG